MHYCFLTYGSWEGNAGHIRPRQLGAQLLQLGHRVTYIVDDVPFNHTGMELHDRAEVAFVPDPRGIAQIGSRRRIIRQLHPDFIHVLNPHAKTFAALAGLKGMAAVADWDEPPFTKDLGPARNLMEACLTRWLRRRAILHIACTKPLHEYLQQRYRMRPVYIPHAPYLPDFPDGDSPFTHPTYVYMGNYYALWDHDIIFHAALLLQRRGLSPPILLMGDGPDRPKWEAFVAQHDLHNVTIGGFFRGESLWRRLRHAHVLLFPIRPTDVNKWRCPSKVFAYAQARRPIITSRVGEIPFLLGKLPTYIDATPEAFADAIARTSGQPLEDVNYHLENHSWSERGERLLAALQSIR